VGVRRAVEPLGEFDDLPGRSQRGARAITLIEEISMASLDIGLSFSKRS
jgi:hypothetical protein